MTVYWNDSTSHGWALAVDFGTSNTAAAVRRPDGQVRILRLSPDADQMPSCVLALPEGLRVGEAASRSALLAPEAFERTPKVRLGEPVIALGERRWAPGELVAAVLRHVVHHAGRVIGGQPPEAVVLTHPADWGGLRQRELHEAAARAGLPRVHLVPEPVAAAAWYLRARRLADGQRVAVFDFGGGTCDVAVLRACLLYTSPSPRDLSTSRMPSSA